MNLKDVSVEGSHNWAILASSITAILMFQLISLKLLMHIMCAGY